MNDGVSNKLCFTYRHHISIKLYLILKTSGRNLVKMVSNTIFF
jgi:hypothetical protein